MKYAWFERRIIVPFIFAAILFAASGSFAQLKLNDVTLKTLMKTRATRLEKETSFEQKANKAIDTIKEGQSEACVLTVTLMNREMHEADVQLEWYILSKRMTGKAEHGRVEEPERGVFQAGKKKMSLAAGATVTETIEPKPMVLTKITKDTLNENTGNQHTMVREKGDTYLGYLVLVTVDGEIIDKEASSYPYEQDEWIEKCRKRR